MLHCLLPTGYLQIVIVILKSLHIFALISPLSLSLFLSAFLSLNLPLFLSSASFSPLLFGIWNVAPVCFLAYFFSHCPLALDFHGNLVEPVFWIFSMSVYDIYIYIYIFLCIYLYSICFRANVALQGHSVLPLPQPLAASVPDTNLAEPQLRKGAQEAGKIRIWKMRARSQFLWRTGKEINYSNPADS